MQNYELWLSGQPDIILTQTIRVQFLPVFLSSMEIVKTKAYYESIISLFDFLLRSIPLILPPIWDSNLGLLRC